MPQVTIKILVEDQAKMGFRDKMFLAQHGFSVFIEAGVKVLFDAGPSDILLHNAELLGVDLNTVDYVVLSHGHWDHADGISALPDLPMKRKLLAHPEVFRDRHRTSGEFNGMAMTKEAATAKFELVLSRQPVEIGEGVYFLGEVPRRNDFEAKQTSFTYFDQGQAHPDFLPDDTAIAVKTTKGLAIITGCSHAGICNIVEHARQVCKEPHVHLVLGGFHLLGNSLQLDRTIACFRENRVDRLCPMHCTDLHALARFYHEFQISKLCAGDTLEIGG